MTDDLEFVDLRIKTHELLDDVLDAINRLNYGDEQLEQELPGDRIGWQVDLWETDGDAVWRITVEAVGS